MVTLETLHDSLCLQGKISSPHHGIYISSLGCDLSVNISTHTSDTRRHLSHAPCACQWLGLFPAHTSMLFPWTARLISFLQESAKHMSFPLYLVKCPLPPYQAPLPHFCRNWRIALAEQCGHFTVAAHLHVSLLLSVVWSRNPHCQWALNRWSLTRFKEVEQRIAIKESKEEKKINCKDFSSLFYFWVFEFR